jgi:hypothetical protein
MSHALAAEHQAAATFLIINGTATPSTPASPLAPSPAAVIASNTTGANDAAMQPDGVAPAEAPAALGQQLAASEPQHLTTVWQAAALDPIAQQLALLTRRLEDVEQHIDRLAVAVKQPKSGPAAAPALCPGATSTRTSTSATPGAWD